MIKLLLSSLIGLFLFSCQDTASLSEKEQQKISDEVREMLISYDADIKKNGLSAEFKYLDNSPGFFWVPPGYTSALSYDSVVTIIKENAALFTMVDNTWDTLTIYPLSYNLASFTGKVNSNLTEITGNTMQFTLIESGVVIKREDGWKLLNGQTAVLEEHRGY